MTVATPTPRDLAVAAYERHAWREAYEHFVAADAAGPLSAADLTTYADAAWWVGEAAASLTIRERAYAAYMESGDANAAALTALRLSSLQAQRRAFAISASWHRRAHKLLEGDTSSSAYGTLVLHRAIGAAAAGKMDDAISNAEEALAVGERTGDADLQALSLSQIGMMRISRGEVREGMTFVDEATIAAVSGELSLFVTGQVYCQTIVACRDVGDYQRAGDWTDAAHRWCDRQSVSGFPGVCRVHRAEVIALRGELAHAEQEARLASEEVMKWEIRPVVGEAFYEIGSIRLRIGDLPAAEEAFRQAHEIGQSPEPGMSLIRLAEGKSAAANASLRQALENEHSRPGRLRILPAQVEAAIASGDVATARVAAEELETLGGIFDTVAAHATAELARGRVLLADGSAAEARRVLTTALARWQEIDAPYEAARTRMLIAEAARALSDDDAARLELQSAKATFERIGARRDARIAAEQLGADTVGAPAVARVARTFLFTDIVNSTKLIGVIGDDAWRDLIAWHDDTLRAIVAEHGGEEIRHQGDGLFVCFEAPDAALECAIAIQRRLADHRKAHGFAPAVRIGVHQTEAHQRGLDYAGVGVHEAARVAAVARENEIVVTRSTLDAAGGGFTATEARSIEAKGFSEPIEIATVSWR